MRKLIQEYNQCSAFPWMCLIHFQLKNNLISTLYKLIKSSDLSHIKI